MLCTEAQSLITPFLEKKMTLNRKIDLVQHIRNCERCREELEFYFVVYVTTGMIEDRTTSGDYAAETEHLLEQTEREWARALHLAKVRRFRLVTILIFLGIGLSFGVGKSIAEPVPDPINAVRPSFALEGIRLPEEIDFVHNAIQAYDEAALDFALSQQVRSAVRQELWKRDSAVMWAMNGGCEIQYELPDEFMESGGSFVERMITGREPVYKPSVKLTIKAMEPVRR